MAQRVTPDIMTLMIGTNDIDIQLDTANAPKRLGVLLDTIIKTTPNALIVLAQMVPTTDDNENQRVQAYNAAMPALVKTLTDSGKHVMLVDIYGAYYVERARLIALNHCAADTPPVPEAPAPCARYQNCDPGYPVIMCQTTGKGHDRQDTLATSAFWGLFSSL